jgi:hypothetical protein
MKSIFGLSRWPNLNLKNLKLFNYSRYSNMKFSFVQEDEIIIIIII